MPPWTAASDASGEAQFGEAFLPRQGEHLADLSAERVAGETDRRRPREVGEKPRHVADVAGLHTIGGLDLDERGRAARSLHEQIDFGIIFRTEIKDTKVAPGVVGSPHDLRDHEVLEPAAEAAGPWHEIDRQRACEGPGDTRVEPSELRGLPLPLTDRGMPGLEHESQQRVLEDFEV